MADDTQRPWHGKDNPMEAMYQWVKSEIARVEGPRTNVPQPIPHPNPPVSVDNAPREAPPPMPAPAKPIIPAPQPAKPA